MKNDTVETTGTALAIVEGAMTRLATVLRELARSHAWNDLLGTTDRLAALLGADAGASPEPVAADFEPAEVGRFVADWVKSLVLPEYLEESTPGQARFRVRLPEEARADGLGELAEFLDTLALRLELSVEGEGARLTMAVGAADRPALTASCGSDRLDLQLDLGATRGALRHMGALVGTLPAAREATRQLELQEVSGLLRFSCAAPSNERVRMVLTVREALRVVGRTDEGSVLVDVGSGELLVIDGEAGGNLQAMVGVGAVKAQVPASMLDTGKTGSVEYRLAGLGGELHATRGDRGLRVRGLTLGGEPAEERHDGKLVASVAIAGPPVGFVIEPEAPGRFSLVLDADLSLRLGAGADEITLTAPAGTRLYMRNGRLEVRKGRLTLAAAGSGGRLEVTEGRALVRRLEPRPGERHPELRFYESAPNGG